MGVLQEDFKLNFDYDWDFGDRDFLKTDLYVCTVLRGVFFNMRKD